MTTTTTSTRDAAGERSDRLAVVLCGSFRRSYELLTEVHQQLQRYHRLLSPVNVSWLDPTAEFVRCADEESKSSADIERLHLEAIQAADFVWLFCPQGYVGSSAAMEVGFARAIGVPVLSDVKPTDETLASMVTLVDGGPALACNHLSSLPGQGIAGLQNYYARAAERRGWNEESPRDTLLLLTEELGELARAVRMDAGLRRDGGYESVNVQAELADVQLYLVHLANRLGVDLASAVTAKEEINTQRFAERAA